MNKEETKKTTRRAAPKKAHVKGTATVKGKAKEFLKTSRKKLDDLDLQPIWDRAKKEFQGAVEVIGKTTEKAAEKTLTVGKQASLQYQAYLSNLKLQKSLAELGGRIYDLTRTNSPAVDLKDPEVLEIIKQVEDLDHKIVSLKEKAKSLK